MITFGIRIACCSMQGVPPLDENLFFKLVNSIDASDELTDEDKDLLRKLARQAAEIESDGELELREWCENNSWVAIYKLKLYIARHPL